MMQPHAHARSRSTSPRSGPKNVALAVEIADGWLPVWVSPEKLADVFGERSQPRDPGFDVAAFAVPVAISDDLQAEQLN